MKKVFIAAVLFASCTASKHYVVNAYVNAVDTVKVNDKVTYIVFMSRDKKGTDREFYWPATNLCGYQIGSMKRLQLKK